MPSAETALVVLVPEAEAVVRPFRDRYDPPAAAGMPAHITLLYPFLPPDRINQSALENVRYPETPPNSGKWTDIVPHLSVAQHSDARELDDIAYEFARTSNGRLPIHAMAAETALIDNRSGRWVVRTMFQLRGA